MRKPGRYILAAVSVVLPLVLLLSSLRTLRALDGMRSVYLRDRAASIAARLETLPAIDQDTLASIEEAEPGLVELRVLAPDGQGPDAEVVRALGEGRELFHNSEIAGQGPTIYRSYIPFHAGGQLRIARIDMSGAAADFLVVHARHNVLVATVAAVVLVILFAYVFWSRRRAAWLVLRQAQLEHLAHLGKMSSVLAHEIRNPLATIKGFAQLAVEKGGPPAAELLGPALQETGRLERLVDDLLLYGREPEVRMRLAEWKQVRTQLEAHARAMINSRPIRFECELCDWRWETDPDLLLQALLNVARNSFDAIGEAGGTVRVSVVNSGGKGLTIVVEDDGPGIPDKVRARLFEPFFTTKSFGTGLGLSITRKLVERLGGRFWIGPREAGGTRAELCFPEARSTFNVQAATLNAEP
jgi:two-component system sensor histidine kinase HydH